LSIESSSRATVVARSSGRLRVASAGGGWGRIATARAVPDSRSWVWEGLLATIDREVGISVALGVGTWEPDRRTWGTVTTTGNLNLDARDEVLWLVDVRAVDTNVLETHEVLATGNTSWDLSCEPVTVPCAPSRGGEVAAVANSLLEDFEPLSAAIIALDVVIWGSGHVNNSRAGVLHGSTIRKADADLRASSNGQDVS
jgi:hypothetical protein